MEFSKHAFITQKRLLNFIVILSFFPFIAFIPILQAEVQPYCYIFLIFYCILYKQKFPVTLYIYLLFVFLYFVYFLLFQNNNSFDFSSIPHILIFIGPPIFFYVIYQNFSIINGSTVHKIFYIWSFVGILQQFFPYLLEYSGTEKILSIFIQRFSARALIDSNNRGVTSLSNEPSYAAIIFFSTYLSILYYFLKKEISKRKFVIATIFFIANIITNASLTIFILALIIILAIIHQSKIYLISLAVMSLLLASLLLLNLDFRIIGIISRLPEMLEMADWNIMDFFTISLGSIREFSVFIAIKSALIHPFGNGYYSSLTSFIAIAKEVGYDLSKVMFFTWQSNGYVNMKPYGYGALVIFELGIIPLLLVMSVPLRFCNAALKSYGKYKRLGIFVFCFMLVLINFNSVSSLPSYWFCLIVSTKIISLKLE